MSRALIVANKVFEADPLVELLTTPPRAVKAALGALSFARAGDREPRWLRGRVAGPASKSVEILCLQDALPPGANQSSSEAKAGVLPAMLAGDDVAIVVAFGTAATFENASSNGCVVVGTQVFRHDPRSPRTESDWPVPCPDTILPSALGAPAFATLFASDTAAIEALLVAPAHNPAGRLALVADHDAVAVSEVNVTKYLDYVWSDLDTVAAYLRPDLNRKIGSLETTHGVIRAFTEKPFAFVSGIVDRLGHFSEEVDDVQNFVGAHNAAVAVAFFIPRLLAWLP